MRRLIKVCLMSGGSVVLAFFGSFLINVSAHAVLIETSPASNSTVAGPDVAIRLRFNSRVDQARSRLTLLLPDASTRPLEVQKQTSTDILTSQATGLKRGAYVLRWQVLASDGHITRGEVHFNVG